MRMHYAPALYARSFFPLIPVSLVSCVCFSSRLRNLSRFLLHFVTGHGLSEPSELFMCINGLQMRDQNKRHLDLCCWRKIRQHTLTVHVMFQVRLRIVFLQRRFFHCLTIIFRDTPALWLNYGVSGMQFKCTPHLTLVTIHANHNKY